MPESGHAWPRWHARATAVDADSSTHRVDRLTPVDVFLHAWFSADALMVCALPVCDPVPLAVVLSALVRPANCNEDPTTQSTHVAQSPWFTQVPRKCAMYVRVTKMFHLKSNKTGNFW